MQWPDPKLDSREFRQAIEGCLLPLRPLLEHQGCLLPRLEPNRAFTVRLRYRTSEVGPDGSMIQRQHNLALPNQAVADAVQQVIAQWRAEYRQKRLGELRKVQDQARSERQRIRMDRKMAVVNAHCGWKNAVHVRAAYDAILKQNPLHAMLFPFTSGPRRACVPPGRRKRRSLCGLWKPSALPVPLRRKLNIPAGSRAESNPGSNETKEFRKSQG